MADISGNQRRVLGEFLAHLRPHWHVEAGLPARIERLIRSDRRLGSRDRRLYRELIYTTLRYLNWVEPWLGTDFGIEAIAWLAADLPATRAFRSSVAYAWPSCPAAVQAKAEILAGRRGVDHLPSLLPPWAAEECPAALITAEYDALHRRAPLWIRLQGNRPELVLEELSARHWPWRRSEILPGAVRVDAEADLTDTLAYQSGMIEIQDLGSQLILAAAAPAAGGRWLDACAGAGGKSLQLAELLGPAGRVEVNDVRPDALLELEKRAARARLAARIRPAPRPASGQWELPSENQSIPDAGLYDGVLIDAPCTGSGTWRRSPHLKAITTPAQIRAAADLQLKLIAQFARAVRPGGRLVYATCSLCVRENAGVIENFLNAAPDFEAAPPAPGVPGRPAGPGRLLTPSGHDGDGFFVATLRRLP